MLAVNVLTLCALMVSCSAFNIDITTTNARLWDATGGDGTLFGLSLAFHVRRSKKNVLVGAPLGNEYKRSEGVVYSCTLDSDICEKLFLEDEPHLGARDGQMFGASIVTSGITKPVIICAPRHTIEPGSSGIFYLVGKCVRFSKNLFREKQLTPCASKRLTTYGYCQAGFSVTEQGDGTVVMGAVGTKKGTGALIRSVTTVDRDEFTTFDQTKESDYLGYSVTNGNFFSNNTNDQDIAGGQPRGGSSVSGGRGDFTGKVLVYKIADSRFSSVAVINPPRKVLEREAFIYFGASVCAVDVNADGYADLLVGAPFYSNKGDEGRVYVYLSQESSGQRKLTLASGENDLDPGLRGSDQEGARFGWTIARAGDLNNDRYQDVIIGAPHDGPDLDGDGVGNGAIYIYHGLASGDIKEYKQKITAEDMRTRFSFTLKQFGYAVAGEGDIDENEYPDVAIGSWESDRVVLLRSRPVMDLEVSLKLTQKEIPVESNVTNCKDDGKNRRCLNATACFKYNGKRVSGEQELLYTFYLDRTSNDKRVYIKDTTTNSKKYELKNSIKLGKKDTEYCYKFTNIFVEDKSKLERSLTSGNNIVFELEYSLKLGANCISTDLCPILDENEKPIIQEKATLILNCSDNTCDYDLFVKLRSKTKIITIGETEKVLIEVTIGNKDERAFNPEITVNHDASLQYEKFEIVQSKNLKIERRSLNSGNQSTTENFRLQGVLESRQEVVFELQYSSINVKGNKRQLKVVVETEGTSGQESNITDNKNSVSFTVKRNVILSVATTSIPRSLTYPITAPDFGLSSGDRIDFSNVNFSLVGPVVKTSFDLKNDGKSDLQSISLQINFPFRESGDGNEQKYIAYPVAIEIKYGNGYCNKSKINPESLKNVGEDVAKQVQRRRKRDTLSLANREHNCGDVGVVYAKFLTDLGTNRNGSSTLQRSYRNREGETIECKVYEIKSRERFTVDLSIIAWTKTLVKYHPKDLVLNFYASATYVDPLSQKSFTSNNEPLDVRVSAETPPGEKKSTPIWIIIVSVLGGVLLLAIAIFALFKFGFFKRNRPPKDISSPQTDDAVEVPT